MALKKTEEPVLAVGKKAKTAATQPKSESKAETKPEVKAEVKLTKPAKKTFAKLPDAPVSEPKAHAARTEVKAPTTGKKTSTATGAKFDPPAISLSKIRKAVSSATAGETTPAVEEKIKQPVMEVQQTTHLPEAMVRKPAAPKKVDKPTAAPGKKTLDDLFTSRNQAVTQRTPSGFNPLDFIKR